MGADATSGDDQVLAVVAKELQAFVKHIHEEKAAEKDDDAKVDAKGRPVLIEFRKAGSVDKHRRKKKKGKPKRGWMWRAADWECKFDLAAPGSDEGSRLVFPEVVCATDLEPDGYLISKSSRSVVVVEMTVPWEENVNGWHRKKTKKYEDIRRDASKRNWKVYLLVLEVGVRGVVPRTFMDGLRKVGMEWPNIKKLVNLVVDTARRSSYVIFINRFKKTFQTWSTS